MVLRRVVWICLAGWKDRPLAVDFRSGGNGTAGGCLDCPEGEADRLDGRPHAKKNWLETTVERKGPNAKSDSAAAHCELPHYLGPAIVTG